MKKTFLLIVGVVAMSCSLGSQTVRTAPGRVQTTTRLVAIFNRLENELAQAVANKDDAKLSKLLAADFEEWTPEPPGSPIPRADWLQKYSTTPAAGMRQMAAKDLGQHVAVHFVATSGASANFIVDIWQKDGSDWELIERYRAPADAAAFRRDVKPTGKQ